MSIATRNRLKNSRSPGPHIMSHVYDRDARTLEISFRNGTTYRYDDVPSDIVSDFGQAHSLGRFHSKYIAGHYGYRKIS